MSSSFAEKIEQILKRDLQKTLQLLEFPVPEIHFEHPREEKHGDYSTNVAFSLSKELKKAPLQIAQEIADNFPLGAEIVQVEVAAPGFVNFWLHKNLFVQELQKIYEHKEFYGKNEWGKGKKWLLEHTSPNPNKAMHLGHLRNNVTGMALGKIWKNCSVEVIYDCIDNNRGIAIAKLMWGFLKFAHKEGKANLTLAYWYKHQDEWKTPKDANKRPDRFVDSLYVQGEADFSAHEDSQRIVRQMVVDWENNDEKTWKLWELVLSYSYQGQQLTLKRLKSHWDKVWHEHEHYAHGKELVEEGVQKGILRQLDDGAILTDLEKDYNIADTIVQKKDGTSLYITQDLALTKLKHETFHPHKMFWVIGPEQSLAMKQVFAVCNQLGIGNYEDFVHIAYGRMSIKGQGKMSSRLGNVLFIDDLIDEAKERVQERMDPERLSEQEREEVSEQVALGALKYSILKVSRTMNMAFDMESSISFEGNSGPYLQYTYARAKSILRRAGEYKRALCSDVNEEELAVLRWIYRFGEVVREAAETYSPHLICNFLFELAKRYNTFYNEHQIVSCDSQLQKCFRLLLTESVAQVLKNGLGLLNIDVPEKM